ncbi:uncharacterized protein METZ01_LOCUS352420, partial [marine metagenome]
HTNALKLLIEKGADVNATDLVGQPPLLWATFHGQYEAVELLVKHGADVNPEIDVGGKRTTALETSRDEDVGLAKISSMVHGIKSRKKDSILDGRKKVLKLLEPLASSSGNKTARPLKNFSYRFYPGRRGRLPDFKKLKPKKTGKGFGPEVSGIIDLDLVDRSKPFAMEFEGDLEIKQAGKYTFTLGSDDGSRLFVNDEEIIDNDGTHGMQDREGSITLKPGNAAIRVQYFEWGGANGLSLRVSGPGMDNVRLAKHISRSYDNVGDAKTPMVSELPQWIQDRMKRWRSDAGGGQLAHLWFLNYLFWLVAGFAVVAWVLD